MECPSQIEAKEGLAINYVAIEPGLIVMPAGNPRSQDLLEHNGIKVIPLDFDEILKVMAPFTAARHFLNAADVRGAKA